MPRKRNREQDREGKRRLYERNAQLVAGELARRGGHCVHLGCEVTKIEWHHRDPDTKRREISMCVRSNSAELLMQELALCDPLCRKHHLMTDGRFDVITHWVADHPKIQTGLGPNTKLTAAQVKDIRRKWEAGSSITALAKENEVVITTISNIVSRKQWAWVSD